jgi:hypothetical protein
MTLIEFLCLNPLPAEVWSNCSAGLSSGSPQTQSISVLQFWKELQRLVFDQRVNRTATQAWQALRDQKDRSADSRRVDSVSVELGLQILEHFRKRRTPCRFRGCTSGTLYIGDTTAGWFFNMLSLWQKPETLAAYSRHIVVAQVVVVTDGICTLAMIVPSDHPCRRHGCL